MTVHERVLELVPALRERASATEQLRRIPDESIAALRDAGVFRALVPARHGGLEIPPPLLWPSLIEVARACSATGWVASLLAIHGFMLARFDPRAQDEVWAAGPDALAASGVAPSGTGVATTDGVRVTGRWSYASGVDHCAWAILNVHVRDERAPEASPASTFVLIPAADFTVEDDWHVAGLRGTGSKSVELNDVFVPRHRVVLLKTVQDGTAPGLAIHRQPFYRLPWYPVFICAFPAVGLGTAIGMLEGFRSHIRARVDGFSGVAFQTTAGSAVRMAAAAAEIDAARLVFRRDVAALDQAAQEDRPLRPGESERIMYDAPFIMDACSRATLALFRGSGGKALYDSNPLQRHFRDLHAMTQHVAMDLDRAGETYGRLLFQNADLALGARENPHKA